MMRISSISFLDLIACSFGAAVLLFLLAVQASPAPKDSASSTSLLIRCRPVGGAKAEIGLEFRRPGATDWERAAPGPGPDRLFFPAASARGQGGDAVLLLLNPASGTWQFRVYLADFPETAVAGEATQLQIEISGSRVESQVEPRSITLGMPGELSRVYEVRVTPATSR